MNHCFSGFFYYCRKFFYFFLHESEFSPALNKKEIYIMVKIKKKEIEFKKTYSDNDNNDEEIPKVYQFIFSKLNIQNT